MIMSYVSAIVRHQILLLDCGFACRGLPPPAEHDPAEADRSQHQGIEAAGEYRDGRHEGQRRVGAGQATAYKPAIEKKDLVANNG